jgi:hypothetical protein
VVGIPVGVKVVGRPVGLTVTVALSGRKKESMITDPLCTDTTLIRHIGIPNNIAMLATKVFELNVSKSKLNFIVTATDGILRTR